MLAFLFDLIANHFLFFALHFESRNVFPKPLTAKQEHEYFLKMAEGDTNARDKLIEHNLRLVAHIIKKYYANSHEQEDLISIGTIGLIKAVNGYSFDKNTKFSTFAAKCIENAILSQMRLWFQTSTPRAEKNPNGVFWHRFPRISTSFAPLRRAM